MTASHSVKVVTEIHCPMSKSSLHKLGMVARAATSTHPAHKAKDVLFMVPTLATPTVSAASSTRTSRIQVTTRASTEDKEASRATATPVTRRATRLPNCPNKNASGPQQQQQQPEQRLEGNAASSLFAPLPKQFSAFNHAGVAEVSVRPDFIAGASTVKVTGEVIYDSGCQVFLVNDKAFFKNLQELAVPVNVQGVGDKSITHSGEALINFVVGDKVVPHRFEAYYAPFLKFTLLSAGILQRLGYRLVEVDSEACRPGKWIISYKGQPVFEAFNKGDIYMVAHRASGSRRLCPGLFGP